MNLASVRAFLFDLDGCVYTGNTPIPGVIEILDHLRAQGRRLFFLTSSAWRSPGSASRRRTRPWWGTISTPMSGGRAASA